MNLSDVFTFMLVLICLHNAIFQDDKNISITLYVSEMGNLVVNSFKLHTLDIQICLVISINLLCGMQFQTNPWKLINYSFYSIRVVWKIHFYGWSIFLLSIDLMIMKNIQRWIWFGISTTIWSISIYVILHVTAHKWIRYSPIIRFWRHPNFIPFSSWWKKPV